MFHGNRWAVAFINTLGDNAGEGFMCLKALVKPLKGASGVLFGCSAARQIESILRGSCASVKTNTFNASTITVNANTVAFNAATSGGGATKSGDTALEYVIRFITLVVEKNQFRNIDLILRKIEESLDTKNGILSVSVESATPLDNVFEGELRRRIIAQTGAAELKMKTLLVPALLGGYRLRMGGFYIDASLKGQIEKMEADLEAEI
jgi:F-type H+-transporting ATPase subunit delta